MHDGYLNTVKSSKESIKICVCVCFFFNGFFERFELDVLQVFFKKWCSFFPQTVW